MIAEGVSVQSLTESESLEIAAQYQARSEQQEVTGAGLAPQLARTLGWQTWPNAPQPSEYFLLSVGARDALLLQIVADEFNSACTGVAQSRLHFLFNPAMTWAIEPLARLADELRALLKATVTQMTALRLLGHAPVALRLFQMAGFRLILGNAWMYRRPEQAVPAYDLPASVELEFRDLRHRPLEAAQSAEALAMADDSVFPDRFSRDLRFDVPTVRRRFRAIAENALSGAIADYAVLAWDRSQLQALIFFGMGRHANGDGYPIAGKWLTALVSPARYQRGVSFSLVAEAMRVLPEGKAYWEAACALDHFASLRVAQKLGFRIGAIAYDLHGWRDEF